MFCFCSKKDNKKLENRKNLIQEVKQKQRRLLELIFEDLANRNPNKKLTQHNFILFISLTGLWADKIFKNFANNGSTEINLVQFLTGIEKTVRASKQQKIAILFNLIKDPKSDGIRYKQFLKMLYHYSKPELKQIMTNDGVFVHEAIIPPSQELLQQKKNKKEGQIIHLERPPEKQLSIQAGQINNFAKAYQNMMNNYRDPGTQFMFKTQKLTYKVSYCNMNYLTKQFASHIFMNYEINEQKDSMNLQNFTRYISNNETLFNTFFKSFHENLWGVTKGIPNFLSEIQIQATVTIVKNQLKQQAYLMLSGNALFFAVSEKNKQEVFRIIYMEGILVKRVNETEIKVKDTPHEISTLGIIFNNIQSADAWMEKLKDFEKHYIQSKYQIYEAIGTGKFSIVYKCKQKEGGHKKFALKVMELDKLGQEQKKSIQNESEIMKILKSQWVVKHYETVFSKKTIYMVTEYIFGEDLFQYVKKWKRLSEKQAAFLTFQIIVAVIELHSMEIIHRDLKPQNIMISYKRDQTSSESSADSEKLSPNKVIKPIPEAIKLIDFGFSNYVSAFEEKKQNMVVGTPNYIAPEVLLGNKPTYQNDTFAIGSILYFMLRGKYAFESPDPHGTAIRTVTGDYTMSDDIWQEISDDAKDLIQSLLQVSPQNRLTLKQAIQHPWFDKLQCKSEDVL